MCDDKNYGLCKFLICLLRISGSEGSSCQIIPFSLAKKTSEKIAFLLLQLWYTPLQLGHGGAETQETRKGNYQFPQKIYEMKVVLEGAVSEVVKEKFPIWNAFFACVKIHQHKRELPL